MPKTLPSGKVDFEFTESFWKTYKPDSVDGKLMSAALKRFEKLLKAAQVADDEDDADGKDEDVVSDKLKAWGAVVSGLTEIKVALEKTIPLLGKDKDSHVNLKESLERALTQMKRGSHVQQMAVNKKKDKYLDLQSKAASKSNPPPEEENKEFENWLKKIDKKERRNWAQAGREFQSVVDLNGITLEGEAGLAINDVFFAVSDWSRAGVFDKLSSSKNFHRNIDRQIKKLTSTTADIVKSVNELKPVWIQHKPLGVFLAQFMKDIGDEKAFWKQVKDDCPVKP